MAVLPRKLIMENLELLGMFLPGVPRLSWLVGVLVLRATLGICGTGARVGDSFARDASPRGLV
jgi:hypothetical protein